MDETSQPNMPGTAHTPVVYEESRVKWEYKCIKKELNEDAPVTEEELNRLGQEGWELVEIEHISDTLYYYFKRPST